MSSDVEISNMALGYVGVTHEISVMDEKSVEAEQCRRFYEVTRDQLLRDFDWPFARRYLELALVASNPNLDWTYAYRYPTDCVKARRLVTGDRVQPTRIPWEIAADEGGWLIYTDQPNAVLRYTLRVEDPERFDPSFVEAFAWRLGSKIAIPLSRSKTERDYAFERYRVELSVARANAANEGQMDDDPEPESIRARS